MSWRKPDFKKLQEVIRLAEESLVESIKKDVEKIDRLRQVLEAQDKEKPNEAPDSSK